MTTRDRRILLVVLVVGAIGAAWLLAISPKRDQASKLAGQVTTAQNQLNGARAVLAAGESARASFAQSYALLAQLGEAVPTDDDVPSLIYQVQSAASASRVDFRSLALGSASGSSSSTSSSPSSSASNLPPGATAGPAGFPVEPFNFTFQGNFFHLAGFLGRLNALVKVTNSHVAVSGRLMTLDGINLAEAPQGFPQITANVSATTFILPTSQGLTNGATPDGPRPATPVSPPGGISPDTVPTAPAVIGAAGR